MHISECILSRAKTLCSQVLCNMHLGKKHSSYPLPQLHRKLKTKLMESLQKAKDQLRFSTEQKDRLLAELQEMEYRNVSTKN